MFFFFKKNVTMELFSPLRAAVCYFFKTCGSVENLIDPNIIKQFFLINQMVFDVAAGALPNRHVMI